MSTAIRPPWDARIKATKEYSRGDMSYPSTTPETPSTPNVVHDAVRSWMKKRMQPDYSALHLNKYLLDPPDTYPFYEYSDFDQGQRTAILRCRVAWAIKNTLPRSLERSVEVELEGVLREIAAKETEDHVRATELAAEALTRADRESEAIRKNNATHPQPARGGHLMAEGSVLARTRAMVRDGSAYARKVTFNEKVNAFTMLNGRDDPAVGGDMLTAVTICDTSERVIVDNGGNPKTIHTAKAISL